MSVSYIKQITDHPETWDFIKKVNKNKLVKNPEHVATQMIFKKEKSYFTEEDERLISIPNSEHNEAKTAYNSPNINN